MSKVIMFSRVFPVYHPKAGEPTNFVEKIWTSLEDYDKIKFHKDLKSAYLSESFSPKYHTIRAGHRFKVGDVFSPRVWAGKPYRSKQLKIANDLEVKQVYDFELRKGDFNYYLNGKLLKIDQLKEVAKNDGLHIDDFECWFNSADFDGQIICWSDKVKY